MAVTTLPRGTRSTTTPGAPSNTLALDIILLIVDCQVNTANTSPSASGFLLKDIGRSGGTTGRSLALLWKRLTAPDSGTYALTAPSGGTISAAEAIPLRGCVTTGDPFGTPNFGAAVTSSTATPNVTLSGINATDLLIWAFATSGSSVTISSGAVGWNEESATTASVMHELSQQSPGTSVGPLSLTMSAASNPRIAALVNVLAAPPPASNTGAGFLALL